MNIYLLVSKEDHREYFFPLFLSFWSEYLELDEFQGKQRSKLMTAVAATEFKSLCVIFDCKF